MVASPVHGGEGKAEETRRLPGLPFLPVEDAWASPDAAQSELRLVSHSRCRTGAGPCALQHVSCFPIVSAQSAVWSPQGVVPRHITHTLASPSAHKAHTHTHA
jgi:hypothetical protein